MKTAIVTDSTVCPTKEQQEKYQFEIVPLNVQAEGKIFKDWVDLSPAQAYQFLDKNPEDWATSAPSPGDFLSAFKRAAQKGAKEIICLILSQKVSATWNSARLAKESAKKDLSGVKIEVIDTETAAGGENLLCQLVAQEIKNGKEFDEVIKLLKEVKKKVRVFFVLETIRYIYRSGRVPEIASKIGAILPLKPILAISEGSVHFSGAATSKAKSIDKVLKILKETCDKTSPDVCLMHADCLSEAEELKQKIKKLLPRAQIFITEFSPIMGYACGRGSLLIAFFGR
jgi:DegV family protein with EDD domain